MSIYQIMQEKMNRDEAAIIVTILNGPRQGEKIIYDGDDKVIQGEGVEGLYPSSCDMHTIYRLGEVEYFLQPTEKDPEVLILGAGHVSRAISDLLLFIGCKVTVVDDRAEYVQPHFFDARVTLCCLDFKKIKDNLPLKRYNGFIVVTRAHEFDNICLDQLRDCLPTYMGMMGSAKRIYYAKEALRAAGWSEQELGQLYGPIGLSLGCETPEEIALSIVSEYLAVTRGRKGGHLRDGRG